MKTTIPNIAMNVPTSQSTYEKVMRLFELHGITIEETLSYYRNPNLPLPSDQYYSGSFAYMGVRNGKTYVTNKLENFGDSVWVHSCLESVEDTLKRYYPIEVEPKSEPTTSDTALNKVLVTQSPFKFEHAVYDLLPYCKNDLRFQLNAYIGRQRRMSSASSAYLYLTVTPEGEMRFTNHGAGQIYLQDTGEFIRDVKRMLADKKPTVPLAANPMAIPPVTKVNGQVYKTIRVLRGGYYIGELETDELIYKDIPVDEAIEYALSVSGIKRHRTLRVHFGDGNWKQLYYLSHLFEKATTSKYQKAEKKVIRRVMHVSGSMVGKIGSQLWDEIKDSELRVSDSPMMHINERRYWAKPCGFFVRDSVGTYMRGLGLYVKQS